MKLNALFLRVYIKGHCFTPFVEFISKDETLCMDKGVVFSLVF